MPANYSALSIVRKYHPAVTMMVDAAKPISFQVTKADCSRGKKGSPESCALARAAGRQWDGAVISRTRAYLIKGKRAIRYAVPQSVAREIVSFDRNHNFAPGKYSLIPVSPTVTFRGRKKYIQSRVKGAPHARARDSHRTAGIRSL